MELVYEDKTGPLKVLATHSNLVPLVANNKLGSLTQLSLTTDPFVKQDIRSEPG